MRDSVYTVMYCSWFTTRVKQHETHVAIEVHYEITANATARLF